MTSKSEEGAQSRQHFYVFGRKVTPPQTSIHPRVVNGRTVHPKVNTSKSKRVKTDG